MTAPRIAREALGYAVALRPTTLRFGTWVVRAKGESRVREVVVTDGDRQRTLECDFLCVGYGLVPNLELAQLLGCELSARGVVVDDNQQTSVPGVYAAGECVGVAGVDAALAEGTIAGNAAADAAGRTSRAHRDRATARAWGRRLEATFALRPEILSVATEETIICRCEDVQLRRLDRQWTFRQAKLYTRIGMGPCQGRVCGPAMQRMYGWAPDRVRAPIYPTLVSTLAGGRDAD
jgi:D-hydroxyproline dehydrogenase subunit alpha